MADTRTIHIFIASPGDLAVERRAFKEVIDDLNSGFGDGAGVKFVPLGWEDTLATTGRRSQSAINREVDRCDVFVLALHRRWGQEAPDAKPYSSYTEEEFHRALDRWSKSGEPEIFVFFKHVDAASMGDPGEQLKKVLAFRKSLEESRKVLYRYFADDKEFRGEIDKHLRAFAKDELPKTDETRTAVVLPLEYIRAVERAKEEVEAERKRADAAVKRLNLRRKRKKQTKPRNGDQARTEAEARLATARAEELALLLAEQAAKAALDGRVEEARQLFARAHVGTTSLRVLYLAIEFYMRTGDLVAAEQMLQRWLAISGQEKESADTAAALGNLGVIHRKRGELERAEEMHKKALAIAKKLGFQEGMADDYSNLGLIYRTRGNLDRAEEMHKKALAIDEELGFQEGIAAQYSNLALIYETRGELDHAEEMLKKALAIDETHGREEGIAIRYSNLGLIYRRRGELERAEEMLKKGLAIDERLGRQEGIAIQCYNLGLLARDRKEFDAARSYWSKAKELFAKVGIPKEVEAIEKLLAELPKEQ